MSAQETTHLANVLVIGSGAAGLRAAIAADEAGKEVLLVGKRAQKDAHTVLAAGGINAVLRTEDPEDTFAQHEADTLSEGYWLSHPEIVRVLAERSPEAVEDLRHFGVRFAEHDDGRLRQRYFGAHKYRRTVFSGDYTGREIQLALAAEAERRSISFIGPTYITRILVSDGTAFGAYGFDLDIGERRLFLADTVILAAGGHTRIYRRSSSRRDENTGDAFLLAHEAGATLEDMELVQFHPTGMVTPEPAAGTLVTEAVRGEGGILRNALGERYMEKYDAKRLELSSRDRVALANYREIHEGRGSENGGVFLDISHLDRSLILERLPRMYRQFIDLAMIDITREPMEVAPTAHYSMGGVLVDPMTHETNVANLWAVGECAAGLHGANRLGGNSLAECVVFGKIVGEKAALRTNEIQPLRDSASIDQAREEIDAVLSQRGEFFARPLQRELRDTMWNYGGVLKTREGLEKGIETIQDIEEKLPQAEARPDLAGFDDLAHFFDLRSMLFAGRVTLLSALAREESRGAHQREDYPKMSEAKNILYLADDSIREVEVEKARDEVYALAEESQDIEGKLLE
jgi:succinate dehydrogenase / fumarate reductase flavoprotein subunit